jgi:rubrerythrin
MERQGLPKHIRTLITLPVSDAPVISCYQSLAAGHLADRNAFDDRVQSLRKGLSVQEQQEFDAALCRIETMMTTELSPMSKGLAAFSRAGEQPFFLPLQFQVPLPNWIAVDDVPNIYHLVELKDTYHRYVVMLVTKESWRILQVNLGAVTARMWEERPELRDRVGREWSKVHFQRHRQERTRKFLKEAIGVLNQLMSAGDYTHLILAGQPAMTSLIQQNLPKHLQKQLIDTVTASGASRLSDVVEATLTSFVEAEEQESRTAVADLMQQLRTGGLAVVGTGPSFRALCRGRVDVLVMSKEYDPGPGWSCANCGHVDVETAAPEACAACDARDFRRFNTKEQIVRKAEECDCTIEVVSQSDELLHLGGVGCLLSYRLPDEYL